MFRDHSLSDLIGFTYAGWSAEAAADDFVSRLQEAGRRHAARTGGEEALIPIILDGENAWEHFEGGGRPFLRALYQRLSNHPELRTVTVGEGCRSARVELKSIFPGSWIDANFYIWIGHPDDHRAWSQLAEAREALDLAAGVDPIGDRRGPARRCSSPKAATGSGGTATTTPRSTMPSSTTCSGVICGTSTGCCSGRSPTSSSPATSRRARKRRPRPSPTGLISPTLDGEDTSYFEWLGAGRVEVRDVAGAMHQTDRRTVLISAIWFGFDRERLYIRLDGVRPLKDLLAEGYEFSLHFLKPAGLRLAVSQRTGPQAGVESAVAGSILELAVPLAAAGDGRGAGVLRGGAGRARDGAGAASRESSDGNPGLGRRLRSPELDRLKRRRASDVGPAAPRSMLVNITCIIRPSDSVRKGVWRLDGGLSGLRRSACRPRHRAARPRVGISLRRRLATAPTVESPKRPAARPPIDVVHRRGARAARPSRRPDADLDRLDLSWSAVSAVRLTARSEPLVRSPARMCSERFEFARRAFRDAAELENVTRRVPNHRHAAVSPGSIRRPAADGSTRPPDTAQV